MIPVYRIISRMANLQRREFEKLSFPQRYSAAQGRVLHFLLSNPEKQLCQRDIEEEFAMRPPSASAVIRSMVENGLITRIPSETDARVRYIRVTDSAISLADEINRDMDLLGERITAGISPEELAVWEEVSFKLLKNLDSVNEHKRREKT